VSSRRSVGLVVVIRRNDRRSPPRTPIVDSSSHNVARAHGVSSRSDSRRSSYSPSSSASFQEKCFATYEQFKDEGKTIVLISHSFVLMERFCDRVLLLRNGVAERLAYLLGL
jgi:hypothetical protein